MLLFTANECETDIHRRSGISRREELGRQRTLPLSLSQGLSCRSVQSTDHVEQLDGVSRSNVRCLLHTADISHSTSRAIDRSYSRAFPNWKQFSLAIAIVFVLF